MRYTQLRAFDAVAREGSFSKAAERLGLTQPAVTVQVRALEDAYGVSLFDRTGGGVTLTGLGHALFTLTQQSHGIEEQVEELLAASFKLDRGQLRLAAGGPHVAMGLIAAFIRRYPAIELEVSLGNYEQVWRRLLERQADIAIMTNPPDDERIVSLPVAEQRVVALVSGKHRFAGRRSIRLQDLRDEAVIFRETESVTQRLVDQSLAETGVALDPILRLGSREAIHEAVATGLGIGFVLERETGEDRRVAKVRLSNVTAVGQEAVVCIASQAERRIVRAFFEIAGNGRQRN